MTTLSRNVRKFIPPSPKVRIISGQLISQNVNWTRSICILTENDALKTRPNQPAFISGHGFSSSLKSMSNKIGGLAVNARPIYERCSGVVQIRKFSSWTPQEAALRGQFVMDDYLRELIRVQEKIDWAGEEKLKLERIDAHQRQREEDQLLQDIDVLLEELKAHEATLLQIVGIYARPYVSKSFEEADEDFVKAVTGVNGRQLSELELPNVDKNLSPPTLFMDTFKQIRRTSNFSNKAGLRLIVNAFLHSVLDQEEIGGKLRIYADETFAVENRLDKPPSLKKMSGKIDFTIGSAMDSRRIRVNRYDKPPNNIHLIAIETETNYPQPVIEHRALAGAASIWKLRKNSGHTNVKVWGIVTNAVAWKFFLIDADGCVSRGRVVNLSEKFDIDKVEEVYRLLFHIVKDSLENFLANSK